MAPAPRRAPGSEVSDKQVAYSVRDGRRVSAQLGDQLVTGYVFGADRYHWALVTPDLRQVLVHKRAPALWIEASPTLAGEERREEIDRLVAPYRAHVMRTHFHQDPDPRQRSEE